MTDDAESFDRVWVAFRVLLRRLTPTERAVFLLHDVCDIDQEKIATLVRPIVGRARVAAVTLALVRQRTATPADFEAHALDGEPCLVAFRDGRAVAAVFVSVADSKIRHVFFQLCLERLTHLGPSH